MSADERLLERLAETHGPQVLAYLARRSDNPADAADLFQAVMVITWRRLSDVPPDDPQAAAWLIGTARRCLANDRRGRTRRTQATERLAASITTPAVDDPDPPSLVSRAIQGLPASDRELLTLIYWEDLTVEQAAVVLDIAPTTARKRLQRARERVALQLQPTPQSAPLLSGPFRSSRDRPENRTPAS